MDAKLRKEVKKLLIMGESALSRRDYDQASFLFRRAFTSDPTSIAAIVNLGYTYVRMGRFSYAKKCFTTALNIDPENLVARKNLNLLIQPEQKTEQFRPRTEEEIYIRYMQWGNLQLELKNYYAAIQYFELASNIHPDFIEPFLKIGLSYEALSEYSLACGAFEQVIAIYPNDQTAKLHLAQCQISEKVEGTSDDKPKGEPSIKPNIPEEKSIIKEPEISIKKQSTESVTSPAESPQSESDIVKSILAQYSSEIIDKKPEGNSVPNKEPETNSLPDPTEDPVMSILKKYQDDIPVENNTDKTENKIQDEEIPNTGTAPLGGTVALNESGGMYVNLNETQKDALRELGNIGASHAATTLSTMLNTPIMLNVPEISIVDLHEINNEIKQEKSVLVVFTMEGQMAKAGYIVLHVPYESVVQMTSIMLGLPIESGRELNEMDESAINEIGNIMVSAFLDGTAELLKIIMLPSPPRTIFDLPKNVFNLIIKESNILYDNVVFFKTELICDVHELNLNLFMLPNPPVLLDIVKMLEKIIEDSASGI
jgi:chemotaxis protein CheC